MPERGELVSNAVDTFAYASLSLREKELLFQLLEGHPNKVIAQYLGATEASAKVHLKRLLRKIDVDNRTQATIWALRNLPDLDATLANFSKSRSGKFSLMLNSMVGSGVGA
jgi:DNA-binding CsgD family transcriptional regulator